MFRSDTLKISNSQAFNGQGLNCNFHKITTKYKGIVTLHCNSLFSPFALSLLFHFLFISPCPSWRSSYLPSINHSVHHLPQASPSAYIPFSSFSLFPLNPRRVSFLVNFRVFLFLWLDMSLASLLAFFLLICVGILSWVVCLFGFFFFWMVVQLFVSKSELPKWVFELGFDSLNAFFRPRQFYIYGMLLKCCFVIDSSIDFTLVTLLLIYCEFWKMSCLMWVILNGRKCECWRLFIV